MVKHKSIKRHKLKKHPKRKSSKTKTIIMQTPPTPQLPIHTNRDIYIPRKRSKITEPDKAKVETENAKKELASITKPAPDKPKQSVQAPPNLFAGIPKANEIYQTPESERAKPQAAQAPIGETQKQQPKHTAGAKGEATNYGSTPVYNVFDKPRNGQTASQAKGTGRGGFAQPGSGEASKSEMGKGEVYKRRLH